MLKGILKEIKVKMKTFIMDNVNNIYSGNVER